MKMHTAAWGIAIYHLENTSAGRGNLFGVWCHWGLGLSRTIKSEALLEHHLSLFPPPSPDPLGYLDFSSQIHGDPLWTKHVLQHSFTLATTLSVVGRRYPPT